MLHRPQDLVKANVEFVRRDVHRGGAQFHHAVSSGILLEDRRIEFTRLQRLDPELLEYLPIDPLPPRAIERFREHLTSENKKPLVSLRLWARSFCL